MSPAGPSTAATFKGTCCCSYNVLDQRQVLYRACPIAGVAAGITHVTGTAAALTGVEVDVVVERKFTTTMGRLRGLGSPHLGEPRGHHPVKGSLSRTAQLPFVGSKSTSRLWGKVLA